MPVSLSISAEELEKLKNYILQTGVKRVPTTNEYELLRLRDGEVNVIVYRSGKLVHNNSDASRNLIDAIIAKQYDYEHVLGTDEVGKGEWYGPLVVVCASLTPNDVAKFRKIGVRDSKTLGATKIKKLAEEIRKSGILWKEVKLMPETYNELFTEFQRENKGLNDLLAWAHIAAINHVLAFGSLSGKTKIIIDKFDVRKTDLRLERANITERDFEIIQSSKGDLEIPVSVASILAKDLFELAVADLGRQFKVDLKTAKPEDIDRKVLPIIAKTHFKNIKALLS